MHLGWFAKPGNLDNCRLSLAPSAMEDQIKASLVSLLAATRAADGQIVAEEMARLDGWLERGRAGLPSQLVHFLENRSYAKALRFLGGETLLRQGFAGQATNPPGGCATRPAKRAEG